MITVPPWCPNPDCKEHHRTAEDRDPWYRPHGWYHTKSFGTIRTYRCKKCHKFFSQKTFHVEYYVHKRVSLERIFWESVGCEGQRQIARGLGVSPAVVSNRQSRLARQGMALQAEATQFVQIEEGFAFDGYESFTRSQYFPTHHHLLMVRKSLFLWGTNAVVLRRKGRMTAAQRVRRAEIDSQWRPEPGSRGRSVQELLWPGLVNCFGQRRVPIRLVSDKDPCYSRILARMPHFGHWLEKGALVHEQVDSQAPRTYTNPLFAVNYMDREFRKNGADQVRETTRWGKRLQAVQERIVLSQTYHNFFKSFRAKDDRISTVTVTHAEKAGVPRPWVEAQRARFFELRGFATRVRLESYQLRLWRGAERTPLVHDRIKAAFLTRA